MEQLLIARAPRLAAATDDGARASRERQPAPRSRPATTTLRLVLHVAAVAALVAASVAAIADQSARFVSGQEIVGVHEIPSFISRRVELTPGVTPEDSTQDVNASGRPLPADRSQRFPRAG